ncbi:hypothetical protein [Dermatobacter hominis]|uniref:hypothetical protein n=1 Tax=Dermatobacter hominis TaxID=2884263 RepID=UPI001D10212A|nr:hypothetical protein [Dermatobacter hominis]UDY33900.1 hypothetical protein LH044_11120 [Dermatobacter hominis]
MRCDEVAPLLPAMSDGSVVLPSDMRAHVEHCLRCQAELVQYRRVLRTMRSLRSEVLEPAPGVLTDVLAAVEEVGERHAVRSLLRRRRVAYAVGAGAATVAGVVGAVLIASRSRRSPSLAG